MIRPARLEDMDAFVHLGAMMHAESRYARLTYAPELVAMTASKLIMSPQGLLVLAEVDNEIVGFAKAGISEQWFSYDLIAFEYAIYVVPEKRGSMIGARLVQAYKHWARDQGAKLITMGVTTGINDAGIGSMYERMGFPLVGTVHAMET